MLSIPASSPETDSAQKEREAFLQASANAHALRKAYEARKQQGKFLGKIFSSSK
jgi:hypothetical protein